MTPDTRHPLGPSVHAEVPGKLIKVLGQQSIKSIWSV